MLINATELQIGDHVRVYSTEIRTIKSVGIERDHGKDWFVYRWHRDSRMDGGIDCGYGGLEVGHCGIVDLFKKATQ